MIMCIFELFEQFFNMLGLVFDSIEISSFFFLVIGGTLILDVILVDDFFIFDYFLLEMFGLFFFVL